jgi:hypothetical protein
MTKFELDKTYFMRSVCDYNCIWNATVLKRTAKFVTLKVDGEKDPVRCKVSEYDNSEMCYPLGKYSMAPILRAEKIA